MPISDAAGFSAARLQTLSRRFREEVDAGLIPGIVIVIERGGLPVHRECLGFRDRSDGSPMRPDCIFRIASMTKPVTVTAAMMLVEQGLLTLGDPVARHLPQLGALEVAVETDHAPGGRRLSTEAAARSMTVQDLMRHTAGFTYGPFGDSLVQRAYRESRLIDDQQDNATLIDKLAALPLAYQPGTRFEYGMSTDVLGRLIEVVAQCPLDRYFAERLFSPLGMRSTGFGVAAADLHRLAEPQRDDPGPGRRPAVTPYDPARPAKWFSGGAGLLSTADDYSRFCRMLQNGGALDGVRLVSRKSVELMTSNQLPPALGYGPNTRDLGIAAPLPELGQGYGLGLGVRIAPGLSPVPGSIGDFYWGGATGPYFWVDAREGLCVVMMLQELNAARRTRYRALLRNLVYQALD